MASEPALLTGTAQVHRDEVIDLTLGFQAPDSLGCLESGSHHRLRGPDSAVQASQFRWPCSTIDSPCSYGPATALPLYFLIWKMGVICEEHLYHEN